MITTRRHAIQLLKSSPSYVFGRFHLVRRTYSRFKWLEQNLSSGARALQIGEKFGPGVATLSPARSSLVLSSCSTATHASRLSRDAFSAGVLLAPEACDALVAEARTAQLNGTCHQGVTYAEVEQSHALRAAEAVLTVPHTAQLETVRSIAGDLTLLEVAKAYLGYSPSLVASWLFWSLCNSMSLAEREASGQTARFHYDVHGLNFLYVNFYLTAADERSGAHVLIEATHRKKPLRRLFGTARLADPDAICDYGEARFRTIVGPAGTGFFEDASCYHKALAPIDRDRLMLQLRYL